MQIEQTVKIILGDVAKLMTNLKAHLNGTKGITESWLRAPFGLSHCIKQTQDRHKTEKKPRKEE